jgi:AraC-like DNA-binding protein
MSELIRYGSGAHGIERLEAHFGRQGYSPHRHDTYAIGLTLWGVQKFRYRGAQRYCLPGQCHILHPDELHDGSAATEAGFGYRIVYVDPSLVQQALNGRPLPFIQTPVVDLTAQQHRYLSNVCDVNETFDESECVEIATFLADLLEGLCAPHPIEKRPLAVDSLRRVRDRIAADPALRHPLQDLEKVAGIDRWALARQFREAFGTSPSRFRTMRQLDEVRRLVSKGSSLVDAAIEVGFSDQSHMSRKFKNAYGLTPARWFAMNPQHSELSPS